MEEVITLKNISKSYGNVSVLSNLSLEVYKNEIIGIVGDSGSGKTTILNILGLLEDFDSGKLYISGDHKYNKVKIRRSIISYLFQNFALVDNETVEYNLDIALEYVKKPKKEKGKMKKEVLELIGLKGCLNKKVYQLSGGEQQRIALARAFLKPSKIVLADEPTGSLDVKNRDRVLSLLKELNSRGKTIIIVTHDPIVADFCDRLIEL